MYIQAAHITPQKTVCGYLLCPSIHMELCQISTNSNNVLGRYFPKLNWPICENFEELPNLYFQYLVFLHCTSLPYICVQAHYPTNPINSVQIVVSCGISMQLISYFVFVFVPE